LVEAKAEEQLGEKNAAGVVKGRIPSAAKNK